MNRLYRHLMTALFFLAAVVSSAQDGKGGKDDAKTVQLPKLERAKEITTGKLPNGVEYYLVTNKAVKGHADVALVQKGVPSVDANRASLSSLPHFDARPPYVFLADRGVGLSRQGYITNRPDAAIIRFKDVPIGDSAVSDSTTLLLFDMVQANPVQQAIIVSGDIQPAKFLERMQAFSMLVSAKLESKPLPPYEWKTRDEATYSVTANATEKVAAITLRYSSPRLPKDQLNTTVPLVSRTFAMELGSILTRRIKATFARRGVPLADTAFEYRSSADSGGDETYALTVYTDVESIREAVVTVACVLADLDTKGANLNELEDARSEINAEAFRQAARPTITNAEYVDKCISAYLYGSDLASTAYINDYFARRVLPADKSLELFNNFVFALLDRSKNLDVLYDYPQEEASPGDLGKVFDAAWTEEVMKGGPSVYAVPSRDTLNFSTFDKKLKVKLKQTSPEPVTGGQIWTFSNGVKVVYKKVPGSGEFSYTLFLKGGYAGVKDLVAGESAFVADMLDISDVAGMSGSDFRTLLSNNGVTMETSASLSDLKISGKARTSKLELLLKSMLSLSSTRKVSRQSFDHYRKDIALRSQLELLADSGIDALIDSIMCPDYMYPEHKSPHTLGDDLPERAEAYFAAQFDKFGDGMLILIGDLEEESLKKVLCNYLGSFTNSGKLSSRPKAQYNLRSGWSTYSVDGARSTIGDGGRNVSVGMAVQVPLSAAKYYEFMIAAMAVKQALLEVMVPIGYTVEVTPKVMTLPTEQVSLYVNCRPADPSGLPAGIVQARPQEALTTVRRTLSRLASRGISASDLKLLQTRLAETVTAETSDVSCMMDAVVTRYSAGKDFRTGYAEHIKAVKADAVKDLVFKLDNGSKVEYLVK